MKITDRIWNDWKNNTGICAECQNNDTNNYWYPLYGLGTLDAEVCLVADTPVYNLPEIESRYKVIYPEYTYRNKVTFDLFKKVILRRIQKTRENKLREFFANAFRGIYTNLDNVYFTNLRKCGAVKHQTNKSGIKEICYKWFELEFNELNNATTYITLGAGPFQLVARLLSIHYKGSVTTNHLKVLKTNDSSKKLIPLVHWGYARRQGKLEQYYHDVNTLLKKELNEK